MVPAEVWLSACVDAEFGYAKDSQLPWSVPEEYEFFLNLISSCSEHAASILIGRVTWETDGLPLHLSSRFGKVLVLSRTIVKQEGNVQYVNSIEDGMVSLQRHLQECNFKDQQHSHRLFVLGGGDVCRQVLEMNICDIVALSKLPTSYQCTHHMSWLPSVLFNQMRQLSLVRKDGFNVEYWCKIPMVTFTSESVTGGHPDKLCDIISDAIVDAHLRQDIWSKVACEVMAHDNTIVVCGYACSSACVNAEWIVRSVLEEWGYDDESKGLDFHTVEITVKMHKSCSPTLRDLSLLPADDQTVVYGYATNETASLMPLTHYFAAALTRRLEILRKYAQRLKALKREVDGEVHHQIDCEMPLIMCEGEVRLANMLRPVGKALVTFQLSSRTAATITPSWTPTPPKPEPVSTSAMESEPVPSPQLSLSQSPERSEPVAGIASRNTQRALQDGVVTAIVLEAQHNPGVDLEELKRLLRVHVVDHVLPSSHMKSDVAVHINGDGEYCHGGFRGGGLTGRKQNVDYYGGSCPMGGGALSGKDYRKMDRSGAYAARWMAKSLVAANICDRATIALAYAIGCSQAVSISVDTAGSGLLKGYTDSAISNIIRCNFDSSVGGIVQELGLQAPIYQRTASGGHFGRQDVPWETPKRLVVEQSLNSLADSVVA